MDPLSELRDLISRLDRTPRRGSWLPGMRVLAATDPTAPRPSVTQPTFALVAGGEKRTVLAGHEFTYGAGQYLVTTLDLPVTAHITRADPFSAFGLALRPELIIQLLVDSPKADSPGPGIGTADAGDRLLEAVVRLLRLVEHPHDFAVLARDAEKEIHWRLLTGPLAGLVRQVGYADSHVALAGRAARWITDRFDQHIRMAELAAHMGVSTATLNRHFRAATAMSPLQYQKHVRLQRARIRLAATPDDVAAAGFAVGYDSPSQFSREYRRMFGSPPGEDARRLSVAADAGDL
ncbi:AraC family transcriptional regulator [Actinoplanes sp. TBRC 11911]|uniref:AraC family transcriptional regulator n=1 Tax=Actinoplanes sp. TBRC 11911 TaxID=2729386 RepID=UPI001B7D6478|nr:AraC family transcriptional regulator [Actinoplanes sp. TBRC 11911]